MARKHNTKHNRSKSRYPERLRARGETSASVHMRWSHLDGAMSQQQIQRALDHARYER